MDKASGLGSKVMRVLAVVLLVLVSVATPAAARDLKIATWNLGWHLSKAEASQWMRDCGQPFALNPVTQLWEPSTAGATKTGWQLKWGREAAIAWDIGKQPPCDVYQANFVPVPVTDGAYAKRIEQIQGLIARSLPADILAFQEVSGVEAVREVLPGGGDAYEYCGFTGFKVQRLVIAWRRELGTLVDCVVEPSLSLPAEPVTDQPRPGLSMMLRIDGRELRIMTVHLKSSCVSPLEAGATNPTRGRLDGPHEACRILHKQVAPLERWLEERATVPTVLLGDFNRNLAHEMAGVPAERVRSDGSAPQGPLGPGVRVRSLIGEVNDGIPAGSALRLLDTVCPVNAVSDAFCHRIKTEHITQQALRPLTRAENLGCRNPVGLDHILATASLIQGPAEKVPLGRLGRTRPVSAASPHPLLALSDHCPLLATIRF